MVINVYGLFYYLGQLVDEIWIQKSGHLNGKLLEVDGPDLNALESTQATCATVHKFKLVI